MTVLLLSGCRYDTAQSRPKLTVSLEPQRFLLQRIAGDDWEVNTLLANGEDPENFDPTLSALRSLHDSRAYFKMGGIPFEDNLIERLDSSVLTIDCGKDIERIEGTHCHHHGHGEHEHVHDHGEDPHIWTSLKNSRIIARNMLEGMIAIQPADSIMFRKNYVALINYLDSLNAAVARALAPVKGRAFMVWHPSLTYFARDYGLNQISIGSDNKEMSVAMFKHNVDAARFHGATVFFVQPNFDAGASEDIARTAGAETELINTLAFDMPAELMRIADKISKANRK